MLQLTWSLFEDYYCDTKMEVYQKQLNAYDDKT